MTQAFLLGSLFASALVSAVFFFKFWSKTGQPLFLAFGTAFTGQSAGYLAIAVIADGRTESSAYGVPVLAFIVVLAAMSGRGKSPASDAAGERVPNR